MTSWEFLIKAICEDFRQRANPLLLIVWLTTLRNVLRLLRTHPTKQKLEIIAFYTVVILKWLNWEYGFLTCSSFGILTVHLNASLYSIKYNCLSSKPEQRIRCNSYYNSNAFHSLLLDIGNSVDVHFCLVHYFEHGIFLLCDSYDVDQRKSASSQSTITYTDTTPTNIPISAWFLLKIQTYSALHHHLLPSRHLLDL